jgi:drug/metabolite transporter (DMT)-like permease
VFFLAGVAIITPQFFGGRADTITQTVLGSLLLPAFCVLPAAIAFHDLRESGGFPGWLVWSISITGFLAGLGWVSVARLIVRRRKERQQEASRRDGEEPPLPPPA